MNQFNGIKEAVMHKDVPQFNLLSTVGYKYLAPAEKAKICNGAGAAGRWISSIIPNTMYGLDCVEAFNIHDYDYDVGVSRYDKDSADRRLLDNLMIIINHAGGWRQWIRRRRAMKYYEAVVMFGDDAFFSKGGTHG